MKNSLIQWFTKYFQFSKKDRNGITVLSILIFVALIINISVGFIKTNSVTDFSAFEKALNEWEQNEKFEINNKQLFTFNPNTIAETELETLLIPDFVKANLLNYRKAGGKIYSANDFRKIYGMNDSIFEAIKDFILIEDSVFKNEDSVRNFRVENEVKNRTNEKYNPPAKPDFKVELNSADSAALVKLYGVGPVFASRIIKYRNLLGGYYKKEQLLEVYNFPEETYNSIKDQIEVDESTIIKIRLNFAGFSELLKHPYLNKEQVQSIVNYRDKKGAFLSVSQLATENLLDSITFSKINPYFDCR